MSWTFSVEAQTSETTSYWQKLNVDSDQNDLVKYASIISNNDLDFITTIEAENGLWTPDRRSNAIGSNGHYDYGICQINAGYHSGIVNDPNFSDPYWQLKKCWELYSGGTRFYGYDHREKHYSKFKLVNI